jgi:hypothetical protein
MPNNLPCGCSGQPRPSLEHNESCPRRLGFFGAPPEWGIGKSGEKRIYQGRVFQYTCMSWQPIFNDIKYLRTEKLKKIEENGKEDI